MNVYFIGNSGHMGCYQVRCLLPLIHNGWKGNYLGLEERTKPPQMVNQELQRADIVVFHRPNTNWHHKVGYKLKQMGKIIVFDNDDTFHMDKNHPFYEFDDKGFEKNREMLNNVINNFALNADLVTTSTEFLAEEYSEISENVKVLPNYIDPDDWMKPKRNEGDKIRVGLTGSTAYHHDFAHIKDTIRWLDESEDYQLVMLGLRKKSQDPKVAEIYEKEFEFWESLENLEHMPFVPMVDYYRTLNNLELDLMLIPRRDNYFNRCKSNIKYLEASMLEIPVIAQSFENGPYEDIEHGKTGFKMEGGDWKDLIKSLSKRKLRKVGKKAKKYVINNYNIEDHYQKWHDTYKELYEKIKNRK